MKTATIQVSNKEAVAERVSIKQGNEFTNYQEYEAYEDHVDSFVINHHKDEETEKPSSMPQGFARRTILRRVKNKLSHQAYSYSYGEYLEGTHVDSPEYDDYLEYNSGDNE